jgi:hypothetical protein
VVVLPYDDHDRVVKLLHALDHTIWDGKVKAILKSEKYDTVTPALLAPNKPPNKSCVLSKLSS